MSRNSFVAGGNILPARFVKLSATGKVTQAVAGENVYGVSQPGTRNAPLTGLDDGYAAIAGENVKCFTAMDPEESPWLEVDAAYPVGTLLKPSTNGIGTATTTNLDIVGAIQLEASTAANQLVQVRVVAPYNLST